MCYASANASSSMVTCSPAVNKLVIDLRGVDRNLFWEIKILGEV